MEQFQRKRSLKISVLSILILFFVMGCDSFQLVYEFGDDYLEWKLDEYFDLNEEQEEFVEENINQSFTWHRQEELPQYIQSLENLAQDSQDGLTLAELDGAFAHFEERRDVLLKRLIPKAAYFLTTLQPEQIETLQTAMLEKNEEIAEDLEKSPEEHQEEEFEKFIDSLEDWFGEFNPGQVQQLSQWHHQWNENKLDLTLARLERRKKSQPEFLALLKSKPSQKQLEQWLGAQIGQWINPIAPIAKLRRIERIQRNKKRILMVDSIMTRQQRQNAIEELRSYLEQMREMVIKPKTT